MGKVETELTKMGKVETRKAEMGRVEIGKAKMRKVEKKKEEIGKKELRKEERKKKEGEIGEVEVLISKSETLPSCPLQKKCGGCQYQGIPYSEQLKKKENMVRKLLKPFGPVRSIVGMDFPYYYRNKVHAVFHRKKDGSIVSGVYEEGSHFVVPVESCQIENQKADAIIADIRGLLKSFKIQPYNEDTGFGLLRHVLIRTGYVSGQIMVVLVTGSVIFPSKNNFVKALRKLHPEITTIVQNINDKKTSMVLGEREQVMFGKGYIEDSLCGMTFRISAKSFYQVNPKQTELLYRKAIELADLNQKEVVLDAYCGTGTIGLIASGQAKEVIGVELNKDAVSDAIINAKRNGVKNARFYQGDAGKFMREYAAAKKPIDVVFMDPPRSGSDEAFLSSLVVLKPKKIVYISCNPETQARDIKYLVKNGYEMKEGVPFDLFPFTGHVETVVLLQRKDM